MANPTTNFGWVMPTSTDLVTDLPADFNVFGQGVDTSMAQLKGGTTGQILSKTSATDMAFTWITNDIGDITGVTAGTGISGGGTSGTVTITNSMATAIDAKGDLIVGTGSAAFDNVAIGANGTVLTADSAYATGLKWAAASAGALTLINRTSFSNVASTTTSFDNVFSSTYTEYFARIEVLYAGTATDDFQIQLRYAGPTTQAADYYGANNQTGYNSSTMVYVGTNAGTALSLAANIGDTGARGSGIINFSRVGNASEEANMYGQYTSSSGNSANFFGGVEYTARTYTGFLLKSASSNITGTVSVYGLAKA